MMGKSSCSSKNRKRHIDGWIDIGWSTHLPVRNPDKQHKSLTREEVVSTYIHTVHTFYPFQYYYLLPFDRQTDQTCRRLMLLHIVPGSLMRSAFKTFGHLLPPEIFISGIRSRRGRRHVVSTCCFCGWWSVLDYDKPELVVNVLTACVWERSVIIWSWLRAVLIPGVVFLYSRFSRSYTIV